jgi:hypothetical protein
MKNNIYHLGTLLRCLVFLPLICAAFFLAGCGTLDSSGVYHGDKFLYDSDLAFNTAYQAFDSFEKFDLANRAVESATVQKEADYIRVNAPKWSSSYFTLRAAYLANPAGQSKTSISALLVDLQATLTVASQYLSNPQSP